MTLEHVGLDGESFDEWYAQARPRVLATVRLVCGDADVAAEATDEAFLRALARWSTVGGMLSPTGWTVRVAVNVARRRARRRSLEERLLRRELPRAVADAPAGEVWSSVHRLPPRQREVIVLRYVADLPEQAIADVLGVSRSAVSSALTDGRRRLAIALGEPITDGRPGTTVPHDREEISGG